jgi:hypothetical protein
VIQQFLIHHFDESGLKPSKHFMNTLYESSLNPLVTHNIITKGAAPSPTTLFEVMTAPAMSVLHAASLDCVFVN